MKKFFLIVFVVALSCFTFSCSSDDDSGNNIGGTINIQQMTVTIDGQQTTFNSVIVDATQFTEDDGPGYTELEITATIGGSTNQVFTFFVEVGDVGNQAAYLFNYREDNVNFNSFSGLGNGINNVVTVNNGFRLEMSFSGTLTNNDDMNNQISRDFENGTLVVEY